MNDDETVSRLVSHLKCCGNCTYGFTDNDNQYRCEKDNLNEPHDVCKEWFYDGCSSLAREINTNI